MKHPLAMVALAVAMVGVRGAVSTTPLSLSTPEPQCAVKHGLYADPAANDPPPMQCLEDLTSEEMDEAVAAIASLTYDWGPCGDIKLTMIDVQPSLYEWTGNWKNWGAFNDPERYLVAVHWGYIDDPYAWAHEGAHLAGYALPDDEPAAVYWGHTCSGGFVLEGVPSQAPGR